MEYKIYKLAFRGGVHFGDHSLEASELTFHADTLFSALCQEAVQRSADTLQALYEQAGAGKVLLSDAFPYIGDELYLPKPFINIGPGNAEGDSGIKKKYKNLKYIPADLYEAFLKGNFPIEERGADMERLGRHMTKTSVAMRGDDDPLPYRVGSFWFYKHAGLYIIAGFGNAEVEHLVSDLMRSLAASGIGGKRSAGYGRFECLISEAPDSIKAGLMKTTGSAVTLSVSLPKDEEAEEALEGASYQVIKRSGFVQSTGYADTQMRKKDLYVLDAGSVIRNRFSGDVYDVSSGGAHPVYRYAKPMFLGVDV